MASFVGSLGESDPSNWAIYNIDRLQQYFIANSIGQYSSDAEAADIT